MSSDMDPTICRQAADTAAQQQLFGGKYPLCSCTELNRHD